MSVNTEAVVGFAGALVGASAMAIVTYYAIEKLDKYYHEKSANKLAERRKKFLENTTLAAEYQIHAAGVSFK